MSAKSLLELLKYYRQCLSRHLHNTGSNAEPNLFKTHFQINIKALCCLLQVSQPACPDHEELQSLSRPLLWLTNPSD